MPGMKGKNRKGVFTAMSGQNPAFAAPASNLPQNYGYNDLAPYEEQRRNALGQLSKDEILGLADQYSTDASKRRNVLSSSLLDQGQKTFALQNPSILEDLNARGLLTSPSAVNTGQADALKEIALANGKQLNDFDTQTFNELNSLKGAGTSALIQGQQDALDSGLDLRRGKLEQDFQSSQAAQEQAMAEKLAKEQGRNNLNSSLIGAGGNLLGAGLLAKGSGLFGGTATTTPSLMPLFSSGQGGTFGGVGTGQVFGGNSFVPGGAVGTGATGSSAAAAPSSIGGFTPGYGTVGAAGIGSMLMARAAEKKAAQNFGTTAGNIAGTIANPIGQQLNVAKNLISNPGKTISNAAKSVTSIFCFDANTPIDLDDGSQRPISQLYIGAETKGGIVESIRTAKTDEGTRYSWKGIKITGKHAVKENGKWIRVEDSPHANLIKGGGIVWSIVTDKHRVWSNGLEMADEVETSHYENLSIKESLAELNQEVAA